MVRLPESITAYIFDLDGVIFDSERAVLGEWKLVADKYGFVIDEETYAKCIGVNAGTCRRIFLDYYGEDFPYDEYCEERRRNFHEKNSLIFCDTVLCLVTQPIVKTYNR